MREYSVSSVMQGLISLDPQQVHPRRTINPVLLNLFQRILLATDGTVTKMLEAYSGEPIQIVKLTQELRLLDQAIPCLELTEKQSVLHRRTLLQGKVSLINFLYAESLIVLDRLSNRIRDRLLECDKPIGQILSEERIETFKELVSSERAFAGTLSHYFHMDQAGSVICRSYLIFTNQRPVMLITEKFPESHLAVTGCSDEGY